MLGDMSAEVITRRPLKSRGTDWARRLSRFLLRAGLTPNVVSLLSILFAGLANPPPGHGGSPPRRACNSACSAT